MQYIQIMQHYGLILVHMKQKINAVFWLKNFHAKKRNPSLYANIYNIATRSLDYLIPKLTQHAC